MKERSVGDQMITSGVTQMGAGVGATLSAEVRSAVIGGVFGLALGAGRSVIYKTDMISTMAETAVESALFGTILGWETGILRYNAQATSERLPQAETADWLIANLLMVGLILHDKQQHGIGRFVLIAQGINPVTVSGARHALAGVARNIMGS